MMEQEIIFETLSPKSGTELEKKERTKKLLQLSHDMSELAELFKDLDELVTGQQDTLDLIECNISSTKDKVEVAEKELVKAEKYQKKSKWLKLGVASLLATGIGAPVGVLVGAKIAIGVASGTVLTYVMFSKN